ncbi:MAG: GntR family transcriptional regulator [Syntrophobacteraceae bacterium]
MLNHNSPVPLYHQLSNIIHAKIRSGEYASGAKIPSEHELSAVYKIGRPTVRQALDLLVRRRVLTRRRGAGTFVCSEPEEVDLFSLAGTISSFRKKGISVTSHILEKTWLENAGADSENPFSGQKAFFFSRLSLVGEAPVLLEEIYLHPDLFPGIDEFDLTGQSLSRIVNDRYHMRIAGGRQNFRISYVDGIRAQLLAIAPTTPILLVKRYLNFAQAENAIYSDLYCRTDQFVFSHNIGGTTDS